MNQQTADKKRETSVKFMEIIDEWAYDECGIEITNDWCFSLATQLYNSLVSEDEPCNQYPEKECYNKDGDRCKSCEFKALCLCTRLDRPFIKETDKIAKKIHEFRERIVKLYRDKPTGCGGSFGELLCWEIHSNGQTFLWLAKKWGISVMFLGEVIADHCNKLDPDYLTQHKEE